MSKIKVPYKSQKLPMPSSRDYCEKYGHRGHWPLLGELSCRSCISTLWLLLQLWVWEQQGGNKCAEASVKIFQCKHKLALRQKQTTCAMCWNFFQAWCVVICVYVGYFFWNLGELATHISMMFMFCHQTNDVIKQFRSLPQTLDFFSFLFVFQQNEVVFYSEQNLWPKSIWTSKRGDGLSFFFLLVWK